MGALEGKGQCPLPPYIKIAESQRTSEYKGPAVVQQRIACTVTTHSHYNLEVLLPTITENCKLWCISGISENACFCIVSMQHSNTTVLIDLAT